MENPEIWARVHKSFSVILVFFLVPVVLSIFYIAGVTKFIAVNAALIGACITGILYALIIGVPMEKTKTKLEMKERQEQIKREQGYR